MNDEITINQVMACLDRAGLKYRENSRYILSQCPLHDDKNPSVQIYRDDWFVNCHAGCGRFHITKPFPELRSSENHQHHDRRNRQTKDNPKMSKVYTIYNCYDEWAKLPLIPRNHEFKTIPLEVLDSMGWRWDEPKNSYYIPYFNMFETQVPLVQWRHLSEGRRFSFLPNAKPIIYGLWNLSDGDKLFIVEGASDCAVMEYCGIPWVGIPSASNGEMVKQLARYARDHQISLVYAGDNDKAGDALKHALDEVMSYEVRQPPKEYKDWGDFLVATSQDTVIEWVYKIIAL